MYKLATALRGGVRESAEVIIDANGLRIFGQEIHECENHITQSKHQLASIIAEKIRVKREIVTIKKSITQYEKRIVVLLEKGEDDAAMNLAEWISEKEAYLKKHEKNHQKLKSHEDKLQLVLKKMVNKLETYQTELRMAKATSKMQKIQTNLASCNNGAVARFGDMQDSLSRIQERQQTYADEMEAMDQIDAQLAGESISAEDDALKSSAKAVLERVKQGISDS